MNITKGIKRKGMSPVVSTIILLMVTLTVSLATSARIINAGYALTGFEKLECLSATPDYDLDSRTWTISIVVKNVGTKPSLINHVYANEIELKAQSDKPTPGNGGVEIPKYGLSINQGATATLNIYLRQGGNGQAFSQLIGSQTLLIKLVTENGVEYTKICELYSSPA
jgi:flagellin-like protein